ncbi:MAG TPA: putative sulfate exporter family transporter [Bacteroidota bacterium]|nr:putative sulfate exporter family transporter [Bacteroidota bacterium]
MKPAVVRTIIVLAALFCLTPYASPPLALALGIGIALTLGNPFLKQMQASTKILLQISVVGLGFGMNLAQVLSAGRTGIVFTAVSITGTLLLGWFIGRRLKLDEKTTQLISTGTAICGGSAIAALGPVINADHKDMSVALATVFVLNAIALFIFPPMGHLFGMSQSQFGVWIAIAIHDTSSVVGAASRYGLEALQVATPIKLTRTLWIFPVAFGISLFFTKTRAKMTVPWFIFGFLLASVLKTYIPAIGGLSGVLVDAARTGLTLTLFFIGAGLSRETVSRVGFRPFVLGIALWIIVSVVSFFVVRSTV